MLLCIASHPLPRLHAQPTPKHSHSTTLPACLPVCPNVRYARSVVSRVDNVRELQASLVPEEQRDWCCLWEEGRGANWDDFVYTGLVGESCCRVTLVGHLLDHTLGSYMSLIACLLKLLNNI